MERVIEELKPQASPLVVFLSALIHTLSHSLQGKGGTTIPPNTRCQGLKGFPKGHFLTHRRPHPGPVVGVISVPRVLNAPGNNDQGSHTKNLPTQPNTQGFETLGGVSGVCGRVPLIKEIEALCQGG